MPSKKTLRQELSRLNECTGSLAKLLAHRKPTGHGTSSLWVSCCKYFLLDFPRKNVAKPSWYGKKRSRQVNCSDEWSPHMFLILGVLRTNKSAVYLTELNPVGQTSSTQETLSHAYIRDKCGRLVFRCCSLVAEVYHIHKRPNQPVEGGGERMGTETHRWRLSRAWVKANGDRDLSPPSPSSSPSSLSNPHLHLVRV